MFDKMLKPMEREPDSEYFENPAIGSTAGKLFLHDGPAAFRFGDKGGPSPEVAAVGHAVHCHVLEGAEEFRKRFLWGVSGDGRTKAVKDARKAQAEEAAEKGMEILTPTSSFNQTVLDLMTKNVRMHPKVMHLIGHGEAELAARATITSPRGNMVRLQAKIDYLVDWGNWSESQAWHVLDLKTIDKIGNIAQAMKRFDYLYQVGHYCLILRDYLDTMPSWSFVFVEKRAPYTAAKVVIAPGDIEQAIARAEQNAFKLADCLKSDHWPTGYENEMGWDSTLGRVVDLG